MRTHQYDEAWMVHKSLRHSGDRCLAAAATAFRVRARNGENPVFIAVADNLDAVNVRAAG